MGIDAAILGFLSWKPLTGYDLKKMFLNTLFIPWSGNNNQIYKSLIRLNREGLVTIEAEQPPSGPSRKVYTITDAGRTTLKTWLLSSPELPADKNTFLIQLAWTEGLETRHIIDMLQEYSREAYLKSCMLLENQKRQVVFPGRSEREKLIWNRIAENRIALFDREKEWADKLAEELNKKKVP